MKRNRKHTKTMSVMAVRTLNVGAVLVMFAAMVIINLIADSTCEQMVKSIREKEAVLDRLEEERLRASARWEEQKTPEKLDRALLRHGLNMKYPRADQVVRMNKDGVPYRGQLSMAVAKRRDGTDRRRTARR